MRDAARREWDDCADATEAVARAESANPEAVRKLHDVERRLRAKALANQLRNQWAEPPPDRRELTLPGVEPCVPDRPILKAEGKIVPRAEATFDEAIRSDGLRVEHHEGEIRKARRDREQERTVKSAAKDAGLDVTKELHELRDVDQTCWHCGRGPLPGDPFERGHVGVPNSDGGREVQWEHRSCNRKARDSHTFGGDLS